MVQKITFQVANLDYLLLQKLLTFRLNCSCVFMGKIKSVSVCMGHPPKKQRQDQNNIKLTWEKSRPNSPQWFKKKIPSIYSDRNHNYSMCYNSWYIILTRNLKASNLFVVFMLYSEWKLHKSASASFLHHFKKLMWSANFLVNSETNKG